MPKKTYCFNMVYDDYVYELTSIPQEHCVLLDLSDEEFQEYKEAVEKFDMWQERISGGRKVN